MSTEALQMILAEGLELAHKLLGKGMVDAAHEVVRTLLEGIHGHTSPQVVLDSLQSMRDRLAETDAAADRALKDKFR